MTAHAGGTRVRGLAAGSSPARRMLVPVIVMALIVVPVGYIVVRAWLGSSAAADAVAAERRGVAYLRPVVPLVAAVSSAQSAAVRFDQIPVEEVRDALADVGAADAEHGARLGSTTRWTALRDRINELVKTSPGGAAAYRAFADVSDLALALIAKVSDSSGLAVGGDPGSHRLARSALQLPLVLIDAGRYTDLVMLSDRAEEDQRARYATQSSVARERLASSAAAADDMLRTALGATGADELDPALIGRADAFRTAAGDVAPVEQLVDAGESPPLPGVVVSGRDQLSKAAVELGQVTLAELDTRLADRQGTVTADLVGVIIAAVLAFGGVLWGLWLLPPAQRDRRSSVVVAEDEDDDASAAAVSEDDDLVLLDARTLLGHGELVRVGRAVQRSRQEPDDAE
ncbi:hypothetical protein [Actinophytocola sp.]|uniref:hypothetical protein n=1 Tax=Actinophytocola sp. TaxID=1872138 RepID=UPI003D6B3ABB